MTIYWLINLFINFSSCFQCIYAGISWEAMLVYHTYLGGLFMLIVFIHAMLFWKVFDQQGSFPHDILAVPPIYHNDNFTIPLSSLTGILMLICIALGGLYMVRRSYYEIFYYLHHFTRSFSSLCFGMQPWRGTISYQACFCGLSTTS